MAGEVVEFAVLEINKLQAENRRLKLHCGQAAFCLAAACQGTVGRTTKLVYTLRADAAGVPMEKLPEPTAEEVAEYGRRVRAHYPEAVFRNGRWYSSPEMIPQ